MAFVLKKVSTYKWPVTVSVPVDGGKFRNETFSVLFRKIGRSQFNELAEQDENALVDAIVEGWDGIKDEDGDNVPFTDEAKAVLLDDPFVMKAIINAYADSYGGAPAKN